MAARVPHILLVNDWNAVDEDATPQPHSSFAEVQSIVVVTTGHRWVYADKSSRGTPTFEILEAARPMHQDEDA